MQLLKTNLYNYEGFYDEKLKGLAYRIMHEGNEIGFVLLETFDYKKEPMGTFHLLILPGYRSLRVWQLFFHEICSIAFCDLGMVKLFTMAKDRQRSYLEKRSKMKSENRRLLGYEIFAITKEKFLCPRS